MKPGYKTTEFYGMLAALVVGLLVLLKVLQPGDHEELAQAIAHIFTAVSVAITNAAVVVAYIRARTELKQQEQEQLTEFVRTSNA